ncbi:MAG: hypothetical protein JW817_07655, partial [Clostridiales bacterium]|nr:hypothetical protein [Clostridiales bacterium]
MSESIEILLRLIVNCSDMLALSLSSILFVHHVLHWKVQKIRSTISYMAAVSLIGATGMTAITMCAQQKHDTDTIAFIDELILPLFFLLIWIILLVRIEGRVWKRAIVAWIAIGIIAAVCSRFGYLPGYIDSHLEHPLPAALFHVSASAL